VFINTKHSTHAKIFKAFSDETRLMVLSLLQNGEKCAYDLLEEVSIGQSTLSHHMKILVEGGIVIARKEGKWMYYSINIAGCEKAVDLLNSITSNNFNISQSKRKHLSIEHSTMGKNIVPKKSVAVQLM